MKVFNESKEYEIFYYDLERGYLKQDRIITAHHEAVEGREAVYDYTVKRYPNGGVSRTPYIVTPAVEAKAAWDEYEDILVYVPYTDEEMKGKRAEEIKARLSELSQDFVQSWAGAHIADLEARKSEFATLHNELRGLLGKEPRIYY